MPLQDAKRVGIWEENSGMQGVFVRCPDREQEYIFWADINQFPAKTDKKRVVLLGESVARGFLYDPYYTPAQVLQTCMQKLCGEDIEIIDLARTDLTAPLLLELMEECMTMEPDAVLIFAGNNWFYPDEPFARDTVLEAGRLLSEQQFAGVKLLIEDYLTDKATRVVEKLGAVGSANGVPITFIIPGNNLMDWKSCWQENIPFHYGEGQTLGWLELYRKSVEAHQQGDFTNMETLAWKLIAIDPSIPYPYELLVQCELHKGNCKEAATYANLAKDTAFFGRMTSKPTTFEVLRRSLVAMAPANNINIIDLGSIFQERSGRSLPGRHFFLDYCHLTDEGIRITIAYAAMALSLQLSGTEHGFEEAFESCPLPDDWAASVGYFYAAIHNSHYGQTSDILYFLCRQSIRHSDKAIGMMRDFVDFSSRKASNVFCTSFESLAAKHSLSNFRKLAGLWRKAEGKIMDISLINAMVQSMKEAGIDMAEQVEATRLKEHSVQKRKANLLNSFYSIMSYNEFVGNQALYHQSRALESKFVFISEGDKPVQFEITYRVPGCFLETEDFPLLINNKIVDQLPLCGSWTNKQIEIPAHSIQQGINTIHITWPVKYKQRQAPDLSDVYSLEEMLDAVYHIYGEIYSISASGCASYISPSSN